MRSSRLRLAGLAFILALALLAGACGGASAPAPGAADVEILALAGFDVADYAGKPLVINFFGSWCGPCRLEAPDLAKFSAAHPGVQFVGIAVNDRQADAVAFMQEFRLDYPIVLDDGSLRQAWDLTGVPTTIFLDAGGKEADRIVGAADLKRFEESLAKAQ